MSCLTGPVMMAIGETEIIVKIVNDKETAMLAMMVAEESVATVIGIIE